MWVEAITSLEEPSYQGHAVIGQVGIMVATCITWFRVLLPLKRVCRAMPRPMLGLGQIPGLSFLPARCSCLTPKGEAQLAWGLTSTHNVGLGFRVQGLGFRV